MANGLMLNWMMFYSFLKLQPIGEAGQCVMLLDSLNRARESEEVRQRINTGIERSAGGICGNT